MFIPLLVNRGEESPKWPPHSRLYTTCTLYWHSSFFSIMHPVVQVSVRFFCVFSCCLWSNVYVLIYGELDHDFNWERLACLPRCSMHFLFSILIGYCVHNGSPKTHSFNVFFASYRPFSQIRRMMSFCFPFNLPSDMSRTSCVEYDHHWPFLSTSRWDTLRSGWKFYSKARHSVAVAKEKSEKKRPKGLKYHNCDRLECWLSLLSSCSLWRVKTLLNGFLWEEKRKNVAILS